MAEGEEEEDEEAAQRRTHQPWPTCWAFFFLVFFLLFCVEPRRALLSIDAASLLPSNEGTSMATALLAALTPSQFPLQGALVLLGIAFKVEEDADQGFFAGRIPVNALPGLSSPSKARYVYAGAGKICGGRQGFSENHLFLETHLLSSSPQGFRENHLGRSFSFLFFFPLVASCWRSLLRISCRGLFSSSFFWQPEANLVKEIAAVELEIFHLEQHLLSLYRAVFSNYLANGRTQTGERSSELPSALEGISPLRGPRNQGTFGSRLLTCHHPSPWISSGVEDRKGHLETDPAGLEDPSSLLASNRTAIVAAPQIFWVSETPCKLSEEIIRCISAVYASLADPPPPRTDSSPSPASSSSTSSPRFLQVAAETWSAEHPMLKSGCRGPYGGMLEILKISADGSRFASAASMLQNYRALIRQLETTNPREMSREEKLAFWVNVHNALVMHAAYNVGGLSVNAHEIRSSVLGCQPHSPEPKLRALFSRRSQKSTRVRGEHPYAVDQREPLVHFALCTGAYSDPAVRVYTAKNVLRELEAARADFLQSTVSVQRETKLVLPKILLRYAADAAVDPPAVLEMVQAAVAAESRQGAAIRRCCSKESPESCAEYAPYRSKFRYIIHGDLVKEWSEDLGLDDLRASP
ncbi:unnamed protein product [Spirodela intermedia]|uniref:DUF547 domain-containing protein n=1 Tax=Spirodela intermedia TaxID=51605 RepID=A0A7I8LDD7_SPIIN|nr:unnamed protein product [Spirodela intermedia]